MTLQWVTVGEEKMATPKCHKVFGVWSFVEPQACGEIIEVGTELEHTILVVYVSKEEYVVNKGFKCL